MYSLRKHLKSCFHVPCHAYTFLLKWRIISNDDTENESDNTTQWYLWLRRSDYGEGRHQLMVSQEQMLFKQHIMRKTEVTIRNDDTPCGKKGVNMMEKGGINKLCRLPRQEQMPGWSIVRIKNTEWLVPFQWFNPFGFVGQPSMWTKEISKCYHLWINPQLLEKLTDVCCFFQDNGRQTVFVTYKQQCWSPSFDRYFASHSIFNWHIILQKYASVTSSICGKWR